MQFALIAHRETETNLRLLEAVPAGIEATLLSPAETFGRLGDGDAALARLDVLPTVDGIEPGAWELARLEAEGIRMLNPLRMLSATHDKLMTARLLKDAGVPHPTTRHVTHPQTPPTLEPPFVVKPRFGSWGIDVYRCTDRASAQACLDELSTRRWFRRQGALIQELVPATRARLADRRRRRADRRRRRTAGGSGRVADERRTGRRQEGLQRRRWSPGSWRSRQLPPSTPTWSASTCSPRRTGGWVVIEVNGAVEFTERLLARPGRVRRSGRGLGRRRFRLAARAARRPRVAPSPPRNAFFTTRMPTGCAWPAETRGVRNLDRRINSMNLKRGVAVVATLAVAGIVAIGAHGDSSGSSGFQTTVQPYTVGIAEGYETEPLLSVGDTVPEASDPSKRYQMVGIPDGLGAHRAHGRRTTLYMNHELTQTTLSRTTIGAPRDRGAIVSRVIARPARRGRRGRSARTTTCTSRTTYVGPARPRPTRTPGFGRFCSGSIAGPPDGFDRWIYFANEEASAAGDVQPAGRALGRHLRQRGARSPQARPLPVGEQPRAAEQAWEPDRDHGHGGRARRPRRGQHQQPGLPVRRHEGPLERAASSGATVSTTARFTCSLRSTRRSRVRTSSAPARSRSSGSRSPTRGICPTHSSRRQATHGMPSASPGPRTARSTRRTRTTTSS